MGLDNGIILKKKNLPKQFNCLATKDREHSSEIEIAYWRKCWQVRRLIYEAINMPDENDSIVELSREDVLALIKALTKNIKRKWYEYEPPYWEWKEYKTNHRENIRRLRRLAHLMKKHPNVIVEFYDSY
jgi:hypothetical protein